MRKLDSEPTVGVIPGKPAAGILLAAARRPGMKALSGGLSLLPRPAGAAGRAGQPSRRNMAQNMAWTGERTDVGIPAANGNAALAHDARNLLSALDLYCELLAGPGVLTPRFRHYAEELRLVGKAGARLVEALAGPPPTPASSGAPAVSRRPFPGIEDLGSELFALHAPLQALAGPGIRVEVECASCAGPLALNSEDLLRILFNLVANAVEAMESPMTAAPANRQRFLRVTAQRGGGASFLANGRLEGRQSVVLSVRDNGPGIAPKHLERIFAAGFSTRGGGRLRRHAAERSGRGLGLSIVRQLAEAAGGAVRAVSSPGRGARFDVELPILTARKAASRPGIEPVNRGLMGGTAGLRKISNFHQEEGVLC